MTGTNGAKTVRNTPASMRISSTHMTHVRTQTPFAAANEIASHTICAHRTDETENATEAN